MQALYAKQLSVTAAAASGAMFGELLYLTRPNVRELVEVGVVMFIVSLKVLDPLFSRIYTAVGIPVQGHQEAHGVRAIGLGLIVLLTEFVRKLVDMTVSKAQLGGVFLVFTASLLTVGSVTWFWIVGARRSALKAAVLGALSGAISESLAMVAALLYIGAVPLGSVLLDALRWAVVGFLGGLATHHRFGRKPVRVLSAVVAVFTLVIYIFVARDRSNLFVFGGWLLGLLLSKDSDAMLQPRDFTLPQGSA